MLSLFKSQLTARVALAAPVRFTPTVVPLASSFSTFSSNLAATKKAATKKATTKKVAAKKPDAKKVAAPKKETVKRVVLPFMFYVKDYYTKHGEELKELAFSERIKYIYNKWNGLSGSERAPFTALYEQDLKRNELEKATAAKNAPPKRPVSSFLAWLNDERSSLVASTPGLSIVEVAKLGGQKWKTLSDYEKSHYADSSKSEMEVWKTEYAKWKEARSV